VRLIIFDFDGTIYSKETPRLFLDVLSQDELKRKKVKKLYLSISWLYILYKLGACKELMRKRVIFGISKIMKGMNQVEINRYFRSCLEMAKKDFNSEILQRIEQHRKAGDEILLLSGAYSPFLELVAKELDIQYWLGTELELSNECATGRVLSLLSGRKKISALKLFLEEKEKVDIQINLPDSYAYADDFRDLAILSMVGHPVATNPDSRLYKKAQQKQWEIIQTE
jgi:HAD superfamily hydrolase (TIGR01490 family)